jgi:hypothetical protein
MYAYIYLVIAIRLTIYTDAYSEVDVLKGDDIAHLWFASASMF